MTDNPTLEAAREIHDYVFHSINGPLVSLDQKVFDAMRYEADSNYTQISENVAAIIARHYAPQLEAAEKCVEALRDIMRWAGKDKRELKKRGWTLEKQIASENRVGAALAAYDAATKTEGR